LDICLPNYMADYAVTHYNMGDLIGGRQSDGCSANALPESLTKDRWMHIINDCGVETI